MGNNVKDVHLTHCCVVHGCKYGEEDCPVETGVAMQVFPCTFCPTDDEDVWDRLFVTREVKRALTVSDNTVELDTDVLGRYLERVGGSTEDVYELRYLNMDYVSAFGRLYDAVQVAVNDQVRVDRSDVEEIVFN